MIDNQIIITPPQKKEDDVRIKWVDTAKAMGLFLVFWGHILYGGSEVAGVINRAIYSFHMPMYFVLSGYVLKPDSKSFGQHFIGKFDRILLPALIVYVLTLPLYFLTLDRSTATLETVIRTIFYFEGQCAYNAPIWFFFCLFEVYILVKLLKLAEAGNKKLLIIMVISLCLSFLFYSLGWEVFNVFGFNKCVMGLFFVSFGLTLKRTALYRDRVEIAGLMALPLWIITGIVLNTKVSMYGMNLGNFWLFISSGITGSISFFSLCKWMDNNQRIREYAKWSIFIVCSHLVLVSIFQRISLKFDIGGSYLFDIASAIFVLLALMLYKPLCKYIDKHIPILMGNKAVCK